MGGPEQSACACAKAQVYVIQAGEAFPLLSGLMRTLEGAGYGVCRFASVEQLLSGQALSAPACIVLAVEALGPQGLDLQDLIASKSDLPIILLTSRTTAQEVVRAMKHGAADILYERLDKQKVLSAVGKALADHQLKAPSRQMQAEFRRRCASLTPREREVYELLVAGSPSEAICASLGLAERTLKHHRSRIMEKLGVTSMVELVRAIESARH